MCEVLCFSRAANKPFHFSARGDPIATLGTSGRSDPGEPVTAFAHITFRVEHSVYVRNRCLQMGWDVVGKCVLKLQADTVCVTSVDAKPRTVCQNGHGHMICALLFVQARPHMICAL